MQWLLTLRIPTREKLRRRSGFTKEERMSLAREPRDNRCANGTPVSQDETLDAERPIEPPPESSVELTRRAVALARERILHKAALSGLARRSR
jgi:hypothetical protein